MATDQSPPAKARPIPEGKLSCPNCGSQNYKKDGFVTETRRQRYRCKDCGKKFSDPTEAKSP